MNCQNSTLSNSLSSWCILPTKLDILSPIKASFTGVSEYNFLFSCSTLFKACFDSMFFSTCKSENISKRFYKEKRSVFKDFIWVSLNLYESEFRNSTVFGGIIWLWARSKEEILKSNLRVWEEMLENFQSSRKKSMNFWLMFMLIQTNFLTLDMKSCPDLSSLSISFVNSGNMIVDFCLICSFDWFRILIIP